MDSPQTWICPGCGRVVFLPAYCRPKDGHPDATAMGRLACALCACWVSRLSEGGLLDLLEAVTAKAERRDSRGKGGLGTSP